MGDPQHISGPLHTWLEKLAAKSETATPPPTADDTLSDARRHIGAALKLARAAGILTPTGITRHLARAEQLLQEHHFHDQSAQEVLDGLQDITGPEPVEGFTTSRDAVINYVQRLVERGDQS